MTRPTLRIKHADGTTSELAILAPDDVGDDTTPSLQALSIERKIARNPDECDRSECRVYRDGWQDLDINPIDDRFVIVNGDEELFGGRLRDTQREGVTVSVILDGAKRDALDATPSGGNDIYAPQPDDQLVTGELLPRVPTIDSGTITEQTGSIAFSESQASPGASITKLAEATGSETLYRPDFTLDYIGRLGSDRADETLSPSAGTLIGKPRIREQTVEDITHVRVLGAQQGTAQVTAEAVVDDSTEREVYREYSDKDIQQAGRAQRVADELAAEYQDAPEYLEIESEIPAAVEPSLGDSFTIELPAYDIDAGLRIMTLERILDEAGDRFRAVLSNRKLTRDLEGDRQRRSVEEFRGGNAGQIVRDSDSQGFDKVDSGEPMAFEFDYPSRIIDEYQAQLRIESRAYRRPASAQGHSHSFSVPDHDHSFTVQDHDHTVDISESATSTENTDFSNISETSVDTADGVAIDGSFTTVADFTINSETDAVSQTLIMIDALAQSDVGDGSVVARVKDTTTGEEYPFSFGVPRSVTGGASASWVIPIFEDIDGHDVRVDLRADNAEGTYDTSVYSMSSGFHTHNFSVSATSTTSNGGGTSSTTSNGGGTSTTTDSETALDPGIVTEDSQTPSNVSVSIDGTTVASGLNHPIDTTVDIEGVLSAGANTIEATSDTLGELRLGVTFEALKNTGGE